MRPSWLEPGFATPADLAACRAMLRTGSRTFFAASLLLPERVRAPAGALYAFCRLADDAVDLEADSACAFAGMRRRLARVYGGQPSSFAVDRAFADVVDQYAIPRALPEALFEGFTWDADGRRYDDQASLEAYAARVAGTVGAMMALLMGVRRSEIVARACDLGVAMQLSNIARDVGEDARAGRLYLPQQWLREVGIDPDAWLARPVFSPALGHVVSRLLRVAEGLYARAAVGIAALPLDCRPGIHAAGLLYAEIGRELERQGLDSVTRRVTVPPARKLALVGRALAETARPKEGIAAPSLEATRFLVDAVTAASEWPRVSNGAAPMVGAWWSLGDRLSWVAELFERLERREQMERRGIRS